jgi:hypothetical protein
MNPNSQQESEVGATKQLRNLKSVADTSLLKNTRTE